MAQASFAGKTGATGRVRGPHLHLGLIVDGSYRPLSSEGRSFAGSRIQFRLPGSEQWQGLYEKYGQGQFGLNPNVRLSDPFGIRAVHPVTKEKNVPHRGEDYDLPPGTALRVLGPGTMTPLANVGAAGNMSRFTSKTADNRPFTLEFMHLSELPKGQVATGDLLATGSAPPAPNLPPPAAPVKDAMTSFMEDLIAQSILKKMGRSASPEQASIYSSIPSLESLIQF